MVSPSTKSLQQIAHNWFLEMFEAPSPGSVVSSRGCVNVPELEIESLFRASGCW